MSTLKYLKRFKVFKVLKYLKGTSCMFLYIKYYFLVLSCACVMLQAVPFLIPFIVQFPPCSFCLFLCLSHLVFIIVVILYFCFCKKQKTTAIHVGGKISKFATNCGLQMAAVCLSMYVITREEDRTGMQDVRTVAIWWF